MVVLKLKVAVAGMCLALIAANPAPAFDESMQLTGAGFLAACTRPDEAWISFCNGYIQATVDSLLPRDQVCFPIGTSRTELVTVATQRIAENPALQTSNAQNALWSILLAHYPC